LKTCKGSLAEAQAKENKKAKQLKQMSDGIPRNRGKTMF